MKYVLTMVITRNENNKQLYRYPLKVKTNKLLIIENKKNIYNRKFLIYMNFNSVNFIIYVNNCK